MASRINTKFILILIIVVGMAAGLVGALWFVKVKTDATRLVRQGEEYEQSGDHRQAARFFERAVAKEPANAEYLAKLEKAVLSIRPETGDEAQERYRQYISILRHGASHHPDETDRYLRLLEELHQTFRRSNSWIYSSAIIDAANEMMTRVGEGHPDYPLGLYYRGSARLSPWMHDRLPADELEAGERDLEAYLEAVPDSDRGWATLLDGRLGIIERLRNAGQTTRANERMEQLRDGVKTALERVKDGPEVLLVSLNLAQYERKNDGPVPSEEVIRDRVDRLVRLARERDDPWLQTQVATVLARLYWLDGLPKPIALIDEYLEKHPLAHDQRLHKARLHYYAGELDAAEESAETILAADLLPVSYLSQFQFELRRRAASLLVDITGRRWDLASDEDRPARMEESLAALARLEGLVTDPDNDPLVLRSRAKIAFAKRDFATAAALFNRLVTEDLAGDYETLMYAALSLEQQGELGAAADRLLAAMEFAPGNVENMLRLARLYLRMRMYEEGGRVVDEVLAIAPGNPAAEQLKAETQRMLRASAADADPVQTVLEQAQDAFENGDLDSARSIIAAARDDAPDNLRLLNGMIRVEMGAGRTDEAAALIAHGLELSPGNRVLLSLKARLESDDPIEVLKQYLADAYADDQPRRAVETLISLRELARNRDRQAERLEKAGDAEEAAAARDVAERARQEEAAQRLLVEQVAPESARFIEYKFVKAMAAEDWETAQSIVEEAQRLDSDQVHGAIFEGRLAIARDDPEAAVRAFRRATDRLGYSALAWRLLAVAYQQVGNLDEALKAFERAYSNNPNDVSTVLAYGRLLERTGNAKRALQVFRGGRRLAPDNVAVREQWLNLERDVGDAAVALRRRYEVYRQDPDDKVNAAALATLLGTTEPRRELLLDPVGNERYTQERWDRLAAQGSFSRQSILDEARREWRAEADRIVDGLAKEGERDLAWHLLRAKLLAERGQVDEGAELLSGYAAGRTERVDKLNALLALGMYYSEEKRPSLAVATLRDAARYEDPEVHEADLALADLFFGRAQYEEALPLYQTLRDEDLTRQTRLRVAECLLMLDRFEESRRRLEAIETEGGADATSTLLRAEILAGEAEELWKKGQTDDAQRLFTEHDDALALAERLAPNDPMPHVLRARSDLREFRRTGNETTLDDAMHALSRADQVAAGFPRTSLTRVAVLQAMGDDRGAVAELERLIEISPEQDAARQLLLRLLLEDNRVDAAVDVARDAITFDPSSVVWRERLGDIYMTVKEDPASAARHYSDALDISPSATLLAKASEANLAAKPPRVAEAVDLIGRFPAIFEQSPLVRAVYGRALAAQGRLDEAKEQLAIAYRQHRDLIAQGKAPPARITSWYSVMRRILGPENAADAEAFAMELCGGKPDAYELLSLATVWREVGAEGRSRSAELLRMGLDICPPEARELRVRLNADLGVCLLLSNELEGALAAFERVLDEAPDNAEVLNNTAYLLAEMMDQPSRALPYAERAVRLMPGSWSVLDTLGWIHYQLGSYTEAETYLRRSTQLEATAMNQLHLAYLYDKKGEADRAMKNLSRAAELRPDPDTLAEINRLADDIRTRTGGR